jgi:cysteine-S-conjugate beta-lyase
MHWRSKLIHPTARAPSNFQSLVPPVYRASTVIFDRQADIVDDWRQTEKGYSYGLYGTPTALELGARIAEIEGARYSFVVPGGQAAIALIYLALCNSGDHALVPASAYAPNREFGAGLMKGLGIEVEPYDPLIGADISKLIRANTTLIWLESPGSVTMEVQDSPAIVAAAHARGIKVALDNTYAAGVLFDAFAHNVDISMQALTKYVGGHSDLLLGTVSVNTDSDYQRFGSVLKQLGMAVSPDDCSLALRGLQTLGVRLERLEKSTLEVAEWMGNRPGVRQVLHPAFASCPGHEYWKRDFTGSSSIFSVVFDERYSLAQLINFADQLRLFKIGYSWGGVTSLAVVYDKVDRAAQGMVGPLIRFNIGLEEPIDLIADLRQAFDATLTSVHG